MELQFPKRDPAPKRFDATKYRNIDIETLGHVKIDRRGLVFAKATGRYVGKYKTISFKHWMSSKFGKRYHSKCELLWDDIESLIRYGDLNGILRHWETLSTFILPRHVVIFACRLENRPILFDLLSIKDSTNFSLEVGEHIRCIKNLRSVNGIFLSSIF